MSKFESEQFVNLVFSILINSKRRRKKTSLLILDWTDISLDLNPFRKRDLKNKPYNWGYSTKGFFLGMKMMILIDYETLTPLFFYVYPANVHESRIYPLILEMLKRRKLIMLRCYNHGQRILRLQELPDRDQIRYSPSNYPKEKFQV